MFRLRRGMDPEVVSLRLQSANFFGEFLYLWLPTPAVTRDRFRSWEFESAKCLYFFCRINPVVENFSRQAPTFRALRAAIQGDQARRVTDLEVLSFNLPITNSLYRVFAGSIKRLLVWAHQAPTLFCKDFAEHYKLLFKVTRQYAGRILRLWVWMRQAQPFYSSFCGRGESSGCDFESAMEKAGWRELTAAHTCYGILNWFRRDWL